jgi:hypothetical protein
VQHILGDLRYNMYEIGVSQLSWQAVTLYRYSGGV